MIYGKRRRNNVSYILCGYGSITNHNNFNNKINKKKTMEKERIYVLEDENGEPVICDCETYLNYILRMIRNTPNDNDLGRKIRNEYDTLRLSLAMMFDDFIDDDEEQIPF